MDLDRLFEAPRPARAPSDEAELDAVAAGRKAMSLFVTDDDEVAEWIALGAARNLVVTFHADPELGQTHVFVARADQQWRIAAYLALWETAFVDGRWSDASENLAGYLLGYTKAQRKAWLAAQRQAYPAWTAATVYALLTREQRDEVEATGRRCLTGTVFVQRGRVVKPSAFKLVPRDHTLARAGLDLDTATRMFGKASSCEVTPALNAALQSNVQFLTKSGWR